MIPAFTEDVVRSLNPLTRAVLHSPSVVHFDQWQWKNDFSSQEVPYRGRELFNQPRFVRSINLFGFMGAALYPEAQAHFGLRTGYLLADAIAFETKRAATFIAEARDLGVQDGETVAYCDYFEFTRCDLTSQKTYDASRKKAAAALRKVLKDSGASRFFRAVITDGGSLPGKWERSDANGWKQQVNTTVDARETSCVWGGSVIGNKRTHLPRDEREKFAAGDDISAAMSCAAKGPTHFGLCTMPQQTGWTWDRWVARQEEVLAGLADIGTIELHVFNGQQFPNDYPEPMPSIAEAEDRFAEMILKHAQNQRRPA